MRTQMALMRRKIVEDHEDEVRSKVLDFEVSLWREIARKAKADGYYAKSTYIGDIATSFRWYAKELKKRKGFK